MEFAKEAHVDVHAGITRIQISFLGRISYVKQGKAETGEVVNHIMEVVTGKVQEAAKLFVSIHPTELLGIGASKAIVMSSVWS